MLRSSSTILAIVTCAALLGGSAAAQEPQSWIHVQIVGTDSAEGNLALNLPLSAVTAVLSMAPDNIIDSDGRLMVAEAQGVSVSDIRQMWHEITVAGDVEIVVLQRDDQTVHVSRAGDKIEVRVSDENDDEMVRVDLPVVVVDALLSGEGDRLNIPAAIAALSQLRGDIIRVIESERSIRIWIDEQTAQ